jgi:uncharacterized membrane protein
MFEGGSLRTEIWHALVVHFPIALLSVSTLTMLMSFVAKSGTRHWQTAATGLLLAGCLTAWVSVYTGSNADGKVSRKLCDPTVLKDHENAGKTMTYLFTAAAIINVAAMAKPLSSRLQLKKIVSVVTFILMLGGTGYLIYAGHLGASLVYEQGAGVKNHSVDCSDYE